jgi:hypothetical protein
VKVDWVAVGARPVLVFGPPIRLALRAGVGRGLFAGPLPFADTAHLHLLTVQDVMFESLLGKARVL